MNLRNHSFGSDLKSSIDFLNFAVRKLSLLLIFIGIAFVGCGKSGNSQLTSKNLDLIVVGMKKEEVRKILGEPTQVETGQFTLLEKTTYYYESRGAKVTVTFLNDAVMSKEGSFNDQ